MISAVADSCSVRLDKANGKVYKFHALVFNQGKFAFSLLQFFFPFYIYLGGKKSNEACRHLPLETDIISAQLQNTLSFYLSFILTCILCC